MEDTCKQFNKCSICNKKTGLTYFTCKCDETIKLCVKHRHREDHRCSLDIKEIWKNKFLKENPIIEADKIIKI
jgi:hypothetical protein